ncbi:MAG: hypothetical protein U1F98_17940 [Verrucomicrobiota bacterium]
MNSLPLISHRLFAAAVREDDLRRARPAAPGPAPDALELESAAGDESRPGEDSAEFRRPFPIPAVQLDC